MISPPIIVLYGNREEYGIEHEINLHTFVKKYKYDPKQNNIVQREPLAEGKELIITYYPTYSAKKGSAHYNKFVKQELIKYKIWTKDPESAWNNLNDDDHTGINDCYEEFMMSAWARDNLPETIRNVVNLENIEIIPDDDPQDPDAIIPRQEWQLICDANISQQDIDDVHDWQLDAQKYPEAMRLAEKHIQNIRHDEPNEPETKAVDIDKFTEGQEIAYKIINHHREYVSNMSHW